MNPAKHLAGVLVALSLVMSAAVPAAFAQNGSLAPIQGNGYNPNYYPQQQPYQSYPQAYPQNPSYQQPMYQQPQPALQGYVSTAPAGTMVNAMLASPLSSEFARVGDRFTATLGSPIAGGTGVIVPAGSQMEGQVVAVRPAGRTGRNGELDVRFTAAVTPNGQRIPLSAKIQTEDGSGVIVGGTNKGRLGRAALNTGVGAGLGAALGTAMGPLSGGEVGRGAIYGTALGGGLGALKAAWDKGKDAVIEAGQPVNVVLDQPLTASPMSPGYGAQPQYNTPSYDGGGYGGGSFQPYGQ